jgi:SAM-dependent methyltransferase
MDRQTYIGVDLAVGDSSWSYKNLSAVAELQNLPFRASSFEGCLNVVTLEHVPNPLAVLQEIGRTMKAGAPMLLVVPLEWEEHQIPHDYFRYTRYGLKHLLRESGFEVVSLTPAGGFFRLLSRRLWNAAQFSMWLLPLVAVPALLAPALEFLDREQRYTLGHICLARKC